MTDTGTGAEPERGRMDGETASSLVGKYPELAGCVSDIERAYAILEACFHRDGKVMLCGNGGSAADCEHIAGELLKGFASRRPLSGERKARFADLFDDGAAIAEQLQGALPAISLVSQTSILTAIANDISADMVFAQQVYAYGREGDVLIALSTSGNSANVVQAMKVAKASGVAAIGFSGAGGGRMTALADAMIRVPRVKTADVQELHLPIYHALCEALERRFFP